MKESKTDRLARRRASLAENAKRLDKKIALKGDHPLASAWKAKLAETLKSLKIHELQSEIESLQKPGGHSIEVPAGSLSAEGQGG